MVANNALQCAAGGAAMRFHWFPRRFAHSARLSAGVSARIELISPSIPFQMTGWSATVGITPPSPGWTPDATFSLLAARYGKVLLAA